MKRVLLVINTLGRAGAERAMIELLKRLPSREYEIFLYVLMGQGDLAAELPSHIKLLNRDFSDRSVLERGGRGRMLKTIFAAFFRNGGWAAKLVYMIKILSEMIRSGRIQVDKLLWRVISNGAPRFDETFDLAIAWLEGGSSYYVADWVKAEKKAAFIHISYENAGYTRSMDQGCWDRFDRIFAISGEVREHFNAFYPEYSDKVFIFPNLIDQRRILSMAQEKGGFTDYYPGIRILTVGRLTYQKAYDIAIDAMKLLKAAPIPIRWYVLGEGRERKTLERKIAGLGLESDFVLLGAVENPYPYYAQADLYVHATRFEGKSIAIQEAQTLGCTIVASDCNGNREQIENHVDGILCKLTPGSIAAAITDLLESKEKCQAMGRAAKKKFISYESQIEMLTELLQ